MVCGCLWFKDNYSMPVLTGAETLTRLEVTHKQVAAQVPAADSRDYDAPQLTQTELTLQALTDAIPRI